MIQDMSAKDTDMIRQLITGYQVARALLAADEIGLLEHIQNKPLPITQLAERTRTHGPTMKRFIRALRAVELVSVDEDGLVTPGPLSDGLRNAARIGIENYRAWSELPYTLRTGKPAFDHVFGQGFYQYLDNAPERAKQFNIALAAVSRAWIDGVLNEVDFKSSKGVADIGGGHGIFLAELLKRNPHLKGILVDQETVLSHAKEVLNAQGVQDRCRLESANFLEAVPSGADVSTLCNLLTDWDDTDSTQILRNCRTAMGKGGRIVVIDRVMPPADDPGHRSSAFLDLFFLVLEGGCIRTKEEFANVFNSAGFRLVRTVPVGGGFHALEGV